jgi:hypothetical protein
MHNALVSDHHILAACHYPVDAHEMEQNVASLCSALHYAHKLVPDAGFDMIADQVSPMAYGRAVEPENTCPEETVRCPECGRDECR